MYKTGDTAIDCDGDEWVWYGEPEFPDEVWMRTKPAEDGSLMIRSNSLFIDEFSPITYASE